MRCTIQDRSPGPLPSRKGWRGLRLPPGQDVHAILLIACLFNLWIHCATPQAFAAPLRAGAATANITPFLGIEINGGTHPVRATHVHDELHARALILDDGVRQLAFIVVDNCLLPRQLCDEAKDLINRHTGIPATNICISATHTHSAGSVAGVHLSEPDSDYARWLTVRITDACRVAANRLAPAEIGWGKVAVPQHVFCRRIQVRPDVTYTNLLGQTGDRVKMNWSSPEPSVDDGFSSATDPEVSFLIVRHLDGRPLSLLANYSLHYVGGVGGGHLSADYYGAFAETMAELLGAEKQDPPFVAMMSNGTSGDINNIYYRLPRPKQQPYEQIRIVARDVAAAVKRAAASVRYLKEVPLASRSAELSLGVRKPSAAEVQRARGIVNGRDRLQLRTWTEIYAREALLLSDYPDTLSLPLQVFRIGELAVAQWPGEIFAVSGVRLKKENPAKPLFNISLANGWFGYIPPPEQHAMGSYETWRGRTSPLETNAIPKIHQRFLELLSDLR